MTLLVVSTSFFEWTELWGVTCKLSHLGTVSASHSVLSWHIPFCLCVAFLSHGLLLLSEFSLQWLFHCIVLSFTATHWPLQKSSCHSTWLHPALYEWAHSHDRLLDSGLWHRWVKQAFLFFLRLCGMVHVDLEGLLDATPQPGWWNRCTFGWLQAKELMWTLLSLKMRCF